MTDCTERHPAGHGDDLAGEGQEGMPIGPSMTDCTERHPAGHGDDLAGEGQEGMPIRPSMTRKVALILAAVSVGALAACDGAVGAQMTFDDTETAKITEIVLDGGHGDIVIKGDASAKETHIRRILRGGTNQDASYQRSGSVLTLDTDCGRDCSLSYEITTPVGVSVRGEMTSGDVGLSRTGPVDLQLTSGDVMVEEAGGPVKVKLTSGDLNVIGGGEVSLEAKSGDLNVDDATGPVTVRSTSGDVNLRLATASSVTASVTSGDLNVIVPPGAYRLRTNTAGDDTEIRGITNDPKATNILDLRATSGNVEVSAG